MEENLMTLRQREIETSTAFLKAQRVYLEAANPNSRKSETELREAAEDYLNAAAPYDVALQELRQYLLASEQTRAILAELDRTERLIGALDKEKGVASEMIEHYTALIEKGRKPDSRRSEEE